jgi:2-phospho-L-lactate guanylyltransferase (CobY/MobA/RfbA family)
MLMLRPYNAIPPAFGPNSFARHVDLASTSGLPVRIVDRPGTRWDLDTPQDLDDLGWEI